MQTSALVGLDRLAPEVIEPLPDREQARQRKLHRDAVRNAQRVLAREHYAEQLRFADRVTAKSTVRPRPAPGRFEIIDLTGDVCHFPVTDGPIFFCGAPKQPDEIPYCSTHCRVAFNLPRQRSQVAPPRNV